MPTLAHYRPLALRLAFGCLLALLPSVAHAKSNVDLNPNLDFTKYKTFAFIGGIEHFATLQVNPNQLRDTVHEAVSRELTKRGLKEVSRDQNPDLAVRYLAESNNQLNYAGNDEDWGGFDKFTVDWWSLSYTLWFTTTTRQGSILIDLIDAKRRDLAWRLFLEQKIYDPDKVAETIQKDIVKGFESYPPTEKEKEEVRKVHAKPPKKEKPQFQ